MTYSFDVVRQQVGQFVQYIFKIDNKYKRGNDTTWKANKITVDYLSCLLMWNIMGYKNAVDYDDDVLEPKSWPLPQSKVS